MRKDLFTEIQAKFEANRCLMCADAPCSCNCPAGVDARAFIRKIRFDNLDGAVRLLKSCNVLSASCAYICPTGSSCAGKCTSSQLSTPIDIAALQKFVMEYERKRGMIAPLFVPADKGPVAVVGSGPAGLGCSAKLASLGYKVKVFEKDGRIGGLLTSTIPSFRLPEEVVEFEIEFIKMLGVEFVTDKKIDDPRLLFKQGFKAVFIGTGLAKSRAAEFIGEDRPGVFQALDFLQSAKLGKIPDIGRRVLVIGGGDTAIDSARVAKRAGAECFILYRRTQNEMPAYEEEIDAAWHDGVEFYFRVIPRSVVGKDRIEGLKCVRVRWHEKIAGMKQGYDVEGPEFTISCDSVIVAAGQEPETNFGLRSGSSGLIALEKDSFKTSEKFIYAGGDITYGGGTAARAVGMGKLAAIEIDGDLSSM